MRKSQSAAFGVRGVASIVPADQIPEKIPPQKIAGRAMSISYGLIVKIAVMLWVSTILTVIFWPLFVPLLG